jgi:multidrug transporter EmrE-like cation transporter
MKETILPPAVLATQSATQKAAATLAANRGAVSLVLASVLLAAAGQLLFKAGLNQIGGLTISVGMIVSILTNPIMLVGLVIFAASAFLWLIALMRAELSFAYPFLSLSYVLVLLGGAVFFDEQITPLRVLGFAAIIVGIFIVASSARAHIDPPTSKEETS